MTDGIKAPASDIATPHGEQTFVHRIKYTGCFMRACHSELPRTQSLRVMFYCHFFSLNLMSTLSNACRYIDSLPSSDSCMFPQSSQMYPSEMYHRAGCVSAAPRTPPRLVTKSNMYSSSSATSKSYLTRSCLKGNSNFPVTLDRTQISTWFIFTKPHIPAQNCTASAWFINAVAELTHS